MAYVRPAVKATGDLITAAIYNANEADNWTAYETHAHDTATSGSPSLGPLVLGDFTDAAAPAAPGAGKTRLSATSARAQQRAGAAGATQVLAVTDEVRDFIPHDIDRAVGATTVAGQGALGDFPIGELTDAAKRSSCYTGFFKAIPTSVKLVVRPAATGNLAWYTTTDFGAAGEDFANHSDSEGTDGTPQTTAVVNAQIIGIELIGSFTGALAGDYFGLVFIRDGDDAADTVNALVVVFGLLITY